jgi:hypothetical protein
LNGVQIAHDAYFVLGCINQYEYPRYKMLNDVPGDENLNNRRRRCLEAKRDAALFKGLMYPIFEDSINLDDEVEHVKVLHERQLRHLVVLLSNLAHQLRALRQRGLYPLTISTVWFFVSFCVGLYSCFQNLGDYTTAHSLALGLLLSWLPVLVLMSIADRNPNGSDKCKVSKDLSL